MTNCNVCRCMLSLSLPLITTSHVDHIQREFLESSHAPSPMAQPQPHQHRTLQPTGGPPPTAVPLNRPRLDDSLDVIRQEFEYMSQELTAMRNQRDEYEAKSVFVLFRVYFHC